MNALQALMVLATATLTLPALALPALAQNALAQTALAQTALAQTALAQTALAQTALAQTAADQFHPKRGLNFDIWVQWMDTKDMLNTPGFLDIYPDWRTHVSVTAINALPAQGYDFARLPMDPAPLLALGPGQPQDALIAQIASTAALVQASGLKVIIDMHSFPRPNEAWGVDTILSDPALFAAYTTLIGRVAASLNGMDPTRTAFEPMNEPTNDCDAIWGDAVPQWPAQLTALYTEARRHAPDLPLVLSGACWGGPEGLAALTPLPDANILYSFHSYTPFLFTHQGADWTSGLESILHHLPYPPTLLTGDTPRDLARDASRWARAEKIQTDPPATQANLMRAFAEYRQDPDGQVSRAAQIAAAWADAHAIPRNRLLLGEFGAHRTDDDTPADAASRARFLRAKSLSASALGIGWAVWSWSGNFGVAEDTPNRRPDPAICRALGLPCQ